MKHFIGIFAIAASIGLVWLMSALHQEPEEQAMNTGDQVGIFMSRLVEVEGHTHKISKVRTYWSNESRVRSQKDGGFFPFGFGPDKIVKFT